jgi:hypothetical protein
MGSLNADPVATGLIASLARPDGNITGITEMAPQLANAKAAAGTLTPERLAELKNGLDRLASAPNPANLRRLLQ